MKSERKLDADHVFSPPAATVADPRSTGTLSRSQRVMRALRRVLLVLVVLAIVCVSTFAVMIVSLFPRARATTTVLSTDPDGFRIERTFFDAGAIHCSTRIELVDPTGRDRATLFDRTGMYGIQVEFHERRIVLMNSPPQEESRRIVRCSGEAFEVIEK